MADGRSLDERLVLPLAYRFLLARKLDESGREAFGEALSDGMTRRALIAELRGSDERRRLIARRRAARRARTNSVRRQLAFFRCRVRLIVTRAGRHKTLDVYFEVFLRRAPTPSERAYYSRFLSRGPSRIGQLPRLLERTTDFATAHGVDPIPFWAVHEARMQLVQERIPAANEIVDLGGSSGEAEEGALLGMGYPHGPKRIDIIDPELDEEGRPLTNVLHSKDSLTTTDAIEIVYHNRSMTDLSAFASDSVDLVFSGESIEHVSIDEAIVTLAESYRVLRPGGSLCLDTPNAVLTRLQSPHDFIHPGHGHEYRVEELCAVLVRTGFVIENTLGICAMPRSVATGVFHDIELVEGKGLHDDPERCYLFYVHARKPSV